MCTRAACYIDSTGGMRACNNDYDSFAALCSQIITAVLRKHNTEYIDVYVVCGNEDAASCWKVLHDNYAAHANNLPETFTDATTHSTRMQAFAATQNAQLLHADCGFCRYVASHCRCAYAYMITHDHAGSLAFLHSNRAEWVTVFGLDTSIAPAVLNAAAISMDDVASTVLQLILLGHTDCLPACIAATGDIQFEKVYDVDMGEIDLDKFYNLLQQCAPAHTFAENEEYTLQIFGDDTVSERCATEYFATLSAVMRHYVNGFSIQKQTCLPYRFSFAPSLHALKSHVLLRKTRALPPCDAAAVPEQWSTPHQMWATLHPESLEKCFAEHTDFIRKHPCLPWAVPRVHGTYVCISRAQLLRSLPC